MEEPAYRLRLGELVVNRHRVAGREDVRGDLTFLQKIERLARNMKAFGHSTRKNDHCCAMIQ